jgi:hypothetical protein
MPEKEREHMAKFRSPYSESVHVPWLGSSKIVQPGEVVTVPANMDDNFREAGWTEVKPLGKKEGSV